MHAGYATMEFLGRKECKYYYYGAAGDDKIWEEVGEEQTKKDDICTIWKWRTFDKGSLELRQQGSGPGSTFAVWNVRNVSKDKVDYKGHVSSTENNKVKTLDFGPP